MEADKIRVHYTGVDLDRFAPQDRAAAKAQLHLEGPVVLCVGNLIEPQGAGSPDPRPARPAATSRCCWRATGRTGRRIRSSPRNSAWRERVGFLGAVPHDDLPAHLLRGGRDGAALRLRGAGECLGRGAGLRHAHRDQRCRRRARIADRCSGGTHRRARTGGAGGGVARNAERKAPNRTAIRKSALRFTWATNGDALVDHLSAIAGKSL
jgi:teichuronic acid biosynthesis glycosyltransferase TuaC